MKKIITIIEDDPSINKGIALGLGEENYEFRHYYCLKDVDCGEKTDLFLLDLNLPDGNGLDFLEKLRKTSDVPVIILTSNDGELDEIMGLRLGADDYIKKPFSLAVLRLRVERMWKEKRSEKKIGTYKKDDLCFDFLELKFFKGKRELDFSKTEIRLLKMLVSNGGQTLTREALIDYVWQNQEFVEENALSVSVKRLRDKLEDREDKWIHTVYGIGYSWKG